MHDDRVVYEHSRDKHTRGLYNTERWRTLRRRHLLKEPWCVDCLRRGTVAVPATEVDHITAHKGNTDLFYDEDNLQSLCKRCHSRKTVREDGRWKRRVYSY